MARIRIGISGWRYAPWRGEFYPPGLPERDELKFAAERFPTIELNERMNFKTSGVPGETHAAVLRAVIPTINAEQLANPGANVEKAVADLIEPTYAKAVIK